MPGPILSQSAEYALRAMKCIASYPHGELVRSEVIAEATHVPPAFLPKVLRKLVAAGLLHSQKGHHGGFALVKPAAEIRYVEILEAVDFDLHDTTCAFGWGRCNGADPCPLHDAWLELKQGFLGWAERRTLVDSPQGPPQD